MQHAASGGDRRTPKKLPNEPEGRGIPGFFGLRRAQARFDQATCAGAVEDANDRALRSSQARTDGATRFLEDYVAKSNGAATATEALQGAFAGGGQYGLFRAGGIAGGRRS